MLANGVVPLYKTETLLDLGLCNKSGPSKCSLPPGQFLLIPVPNSSSFFRSISPVPLPHSNPCLGGKHYSPLHQKEEVLPLSSSCILQNQAAPPAWAKTWDWSLVSDEVGVGRDGPHTAT